MNRMITSSYNVFHKFYMPCIILMVCFMIASCSGDKNAQKKHKDAEVQTTSLELKVYKDKKNEYFMFALPKGWTVREYSDPRTKVSFNHPSADGVFIRFIVREAPDETFNSMKHNDEITAQQMNSRGISCDVKETEFLGMQCSEISAQMPNNAGTTILRKFLVSGLHFNIQYSAPTQDLFKKYLDDSIESLETLVILKNQNNNPQRVKNQQIANYVRLAKLTAEIFSVTEAKDILKEALKIFPESKEIHDAIKELDKKAQKEGNQ